MEKRMSLTLAVSKGYLMDEAILLFNQAGIQFEDDLSTSRKLFTWDTSRQIRLIQVRPWDVDVYVAQGAADLGIVGEDVLIEKKSKNPVLLDLKFGACKLILAGLEHQLPKLQHHMSVATKYPNATQAYFLSKGLKVNLIKLYGSIELAPITGLSDIICDLTATGKTLKENHLAIIDTVFHSTARLIANPVSMKHQYEAIVHWVNRLAPYIHV
jgi:ATP phosphoribosyltransferase